jgi:transcriptional regulator with XRE-family HTH domain
MPFGDNLRAQRARKGWSQAAAARALGVSPRSYQNWEQGTSEPRLATLARMARVFAVSADELLAGLDTPVPKSRKRR